MLDRKTMPALAKPGKVEIIQAQKLTFTNGIPVYYVNAGTQDVLKIELLFRAGTRESGQPAVADFTNSMLEEGTKRHSAEEIASQLDYYGSFLETAVYHDYAAVTLYTLGKHAGRVLPMLEELIKEPSFPEQEFEVNRTNKKQRFLVDDQKVRVVAARNFPALLFGEKHPYGHIPKIEEFDTMKRENLPIFHSRHYHSGSCTMIISGRVSDDFLKLTGEFFGKDNWAGTTSSKPAGKAQMPEIKPSAEKKNIIQRKGVVQSAIKVGMPLFLKNHPDAIPFQILNTVLGGYFGSRLMSNIREDKGYTYGISSGVIFLENAGFFQISSEVGSDVCSKALTEVYKEIARLRTEPVASSELQLVKNYLSGNFMRSMDGPFALAERFKQLWLCNLDYSYYEKYMQALSGITADELLRIAGKYLNEDSLYELVVGVK
jgi:predicted Zn-dependent peptidase